MNAVVPRWGNKALGIINQVLLCPFISSKNFESEAFESVILMAAAPNRFIKDKPGKRSSKSSA